MNNNIVIKIKKKPHSSLKMPEPITKINIMPKSYKNISKIRFIITSMNKNPKKFQIKII